jgi:hypothetical protein
MTLQIKAEVLLNNSNWERTLNKTQKQMQGFGKSMKTIANGVKGAIAFMGINAIGDALSDAAKAADEDAASIRVLNKVLENSWKATDEQTRAVDQFIQQTSLQVGILDDELRPAFAKIATTTKNPTKAMERFQVALDVAAGTGKDLNTVSQAMAKFFGGQKSALDKLIPGIKDAGDKIEFMKSKYEGAAEAGAGSFDKINVAVENAKEAIGTALLPQIEQFVKWLGSDKGQKAMDQWISDLKMLIGLASDFLGLVRNVAGIFDQSQKDQAISKAAKSKNGLNYLGGGQATGPNAYTNAESLNRSSSGNMFAPTTINIYGTVSGNDVVKALKNIAGQKGMTLGRLLR